MIVVRTVHDAIATTRVRDARVVATGELAVRTKVPKGPLNCPHCMSTPPS